MNEAGIGYGWEMNTMVFMMFIFPLVTDTEKSFGQMGVHLKPLIEIFLRIMSICHEYVY